MATFNGVLMEQVVALEPDLVLAAGNFFTPPADIARMRELGYPVLVVYAETVDEVLHDIELIGDALGEGDAARVITAGMQADIDQVTAAVAAVGDRPRTFYQIGSEPEIYAPGARLLRRGHGRARGRRSDHDERPQRVRDPRRAARRGRTRRSSWWGTRSTASAPRT